MLQEAGGHHCYTGRLGDWNVTNVSQAEPEYSIERGYTGEEGEEGGEGGEEDLEHEIVELPGGRYRAVLQVGPPTPTTCLSSDCCPFLPCYHRSWWGEQEEVGERDQD